VLFDMSIHDNVALGRRGGLPVTRAEVEAACRRVLMHEFISGLPEGYDTMLGSDGASLSGGQKQRLAMARVMLRDPDVLVLGTFLFSVFVAAGLLFLHRRSDFCAGPYFPCGGVRRRAPLAPGPYHDRHYTRPRADNRRRLCVRSEGRLCSGKWMSGGPGHIHLWGFRQLGHLSRSARPSRTSSFKPCGHAEDRAHPFATASVWPPLPAHLTFRSFRADSRRSGRPVHP
jgi:hypothetical protein